MKVYAIFLVCVIGVWGFSRVSEELDRRVDGRDTACAVHPCLAQEHDPDLDRAQAVLAQQEAYESAAEEEGVDAPTGDCTNSHCSHRIAP